MLPIARGDPLFVSPATSDFRLQPSSPCIDTGNQFVDTDHGQVGFQPLPPFDIGGLKRVVDGDENGEAEVDMGTHEVQP